MQKSQAQGCQQSTSFVCYEENLVFIRSQLEKVLIVLKEEHESICRQHAQQNQKLASIILEKEEEIRELKLRLQQQLKSPGAPVRILLKTNKGIECHSTHRTKPKKQLNIDETFSKIEIRQSKQNRMSLQINTSSSKKIGRLSTSSIKNKIIRQDKLADQSSPKSFFNCGSTGKKLMLCLKSKEAKNSESYEYLTTSDNLKSPKSSIFSNERLREEKAKANDGKVRESENKNSNLQGKKLMTKNSNYKSANNPLLNSRENTSLSDLNCKRHIDVIIPVKIINVSNVKPR